MACIAKINNAADFFVLADTSSDLIPIVSTINNLIDLVCKAVIALFKKFAPETYESMKKNVWVAYLNEKDAMACCLLTIPFLNFPYAIMLHICINYNKRLQNDFTKGVQEGLTGKL